MPPPPPVGDGQACTERKLSAGCAASRMWAQQSAGDTAFPRASLSCSSRPGCFRIRHAAGRVHPSVPPLPLDGSGLMLSETTCFFSRADPPVTGVHHLPGGRG